MTRYVVIGAGALGGILAAELHDSGLDVVLVARGAHGEAISAGGLRIRRPHTIDVVRVPVASGPDDIALDPDDVLVLAVKTQDVEAVLQTWSWLPVAGGRVAADLPILTLQNGLATEDAVVRRFRQVYAATAWIAASHLTPGEVVSPSWPSVGIVWLGPHHGGTSERADAIAADLRTARFTATAVPEIGRWKAHKLRGNIVNGLDLFVGAEADLAEAGALLLAELDAVYAAAGIIPVDPAEAVTDLPVLQIDPVPGHQHRRSTWQSFARGAGSEIDFLNGEIVLLGRRHDVPTPVNEALQRTLGLRSSTDPIDVSELLPTRKDHPMTDTTTTSDLLVSPLAAAAAVTGGARFIDVRSDGFRARTGGLPQAEIIAKDAIDEAFPDAADTRPVVVICGSVNGSRPVAEQLVARGFADVVHVDGGFAAWKDAGLLTTPATDPDA